MAFATFAGVLQAALPLFFELPLKGRIAIKRNGRRMVEPTMEIATRLKPRWSEREGN